MNWPLFFVSFLKIQTNEHVGEFFKMELLPTEILEHIFVLLPNLKAVQNCHNTCDQWRQIIKKIFKNKGIYVKNLKNF